MAKPEHQVINQELERALAQCAAGDRRAFATIYELTAPKFLSLLQRQLNDTEAARDVLQKAYVSIWKNASKFDASKGKAFTWMLVIIRNRGLDHLRSCARAPETAEIEHALVDTRPEPEQAARTSAAGRLIAKHLAGLPEHIARSISLNVVYGFSCTEIGHLLDVSPNTVKGWVRRGLKRLRSEIPESSVS
ncbi:MAG: sigma-70 family RNA polymerase sigma factor, partial [Henriciella sp.]